MLESEYVCRLSLSTVAKQLVELGLNKGTSGNVSLRFDTGFLVTPSGVGVEDLTPDLMVLMQDDGSYAGQLQPSSEWRFHRDILRNRPEINAVIHTHSMFATTLACMRESIPPFHYMIAAAGGDSIVCAPYALFGSQALSEGALAALTGRKACLLANHGMLALGHDLAGALALAVEVENLCEQYWRVRQMGQPVLLTDAEMQAVFEQFKDYGKWAKRPLSPKSKQ